MKRMTRVSYLTSLAVILAGSWMACTSKPAAPPERDPAGFSDRKGPARLLSKQDVESAVSSGALKLSEAKLLIDNDESFLTKLAAIESAQPGETVRMVYYIFSKDESSSYFINTIVNQAKKGVKFHILVDLITNYGNLDLFKWMEREGRVNGQNNIEVRLFGRPSEYVTRDALFLTRPCKAVKGTPKANECSMAKWSDITRELRGKDKKALRTYTDAYSSLLLAGLYGRSPVAAKVAFDYGSQISDMKSQTGEVSAKQKEELRKLIKLVFDAKIFGDETAYLKLGLAMTLYASDVNPVLNQLYGRFPFEQPDGEKSFEHWEHLTDYTHHKLLTVGNRFFQLGGRNIENSYHMKLNELSKKYTFIDTDFAGTIQSGGEAITKSYDALWNYSDVVVGLPEISTFLNNDMAANPGSVQFAVGACEAKGLGKNRDAMAQCLMAAYTQLPQDYEYKNEKGETVVLARYRNETERMDEIGKLVAENMDKYVREYQSVHLKGNEPTQSIKSSGYTAVAGANSLLSEEDRKAGIYYIENLPFSRGVDTKPKWPWDRPAKVERTLNFNNGDEWANNKNMHHLWLRSMEHACAASAKSGVATNVILHSAYWFPPTNLLNAFRNMMDGAWDCGKVTVKVITNSFQTTDLNVLNVFARYQMHAFYSVYDANRKNKKSAKFEYYEYKPGAGTDPSKVLSLHTKVSVIGNDLMIGSANADIRSFMMDTNNGVYIHNAPKLAATYNTWINSLLPAKGASESRWLKEMSNQFRIPLGSESNYSCPDKILATYATQNPASTGNLRGDDMCFMEALAVRFKFLGNIKRNKPDDWKQMKDLQKAVATDIYGDIMAIMSNKNWEQYKPARGVGDRQQQHINKKILEEQERIGNDFNRKYQVF